MIKTTVIPADRKITIDIPEAYVGKQIEVLLYAMDETQDIEEKQVTMQQFRGILSAEEAGKLQEYVKQSRDEWERDF